MFGKRTAARPYIFLDVDGTISPSQFPQDDYFYSSWNGGHYFSSELREQLSLLPAEKIWLTGWGQEAEDTFQCGWKTLKGDRSRGDLWKFFAIQEFIESHAVSKIVWLDDEIEKWQEAMPAFSASSLKISPLIHLGLSQHHLLIVKNFLLER